jgi:hypothetical protein
VGRNAFVPAELTSGPFTVETARRAGLAPWQLEGSSWRPITHGIYVWAGLPPSPILDLAAARLRLPPSAVFSGLTAAWLHGLDVEPCDPIDVTVPPNAGVSSRVGLALRRNVLAPWDVTTRRGFDATTIERSLADLSLTLEIAEVIVVADAATHVGLTTVEKLSSTAHRLAFRLGPAKLRRVIDLVEPAAESPMESRLRMIIVLAGLPRPVAQHDVVGRNRELIARLDLYYPEKKLGIEYDGAVHRLSLAEDNRRQNRLLAEGVTLLRFTAGDVFRHPDRIAGQVRAMLISR